MLYGFTAVQVQMRLCYIHSVLCQLGVPIIYLLQALGTGVQSLSQTAPVTMQSPCSSEHTTTTADTAPAAGRTGMLALL